MNMINRVPSSSRPNEGQPAVAQPVRTQTSTGTSTGSGGAQVPPSKKGRTKNRLPMLVIAILAVVLLAAGVYAYSQFNSSLIARNQYQAVFLTNGQVYFESL